MMSFATDTASSDFGVHDVVQVLASGSDLGSAQRKVNVRSHGPKRPSNAAGHV